METAYTDAAGRAVDASRITILTGGIDGYTLKPGVCQWDGDVAYSTKLTFEGSATSMS